MPSFHNKVMLMLTALFALFVFTGDLVADEFCKASGNCSASETQGSEGSESDHGCPACACAVQSGAVVRSEAVSLMPGCLVVVELVLTWIDGAAPDGVRAAIDHPPQLA